MPEQKRDKDYKGRLFIISAPSGAGKTTLCNALMENFPELSYSISHTTRNPRKNEINGRDYYFISKEEFERKKTGGEWAEWARVHGNYYGTCENKLNTLLDAGKNILLDIDVAGTLQIKSRHPGSIAIFIMPPSMEVLEDRLRSRGTDSEEEIRARIQHAQKEIASRHFFNHVIVNDRLDEAIDALCTLFRKYMTENRRS